MDDSLLIAILVFASLVFIALLAGVVLAWNRSRALALALLALGLLLLATGYLLTTKITALLEVLTEEL